ncbi:MAG TPA: hypothetical protein ENL08_02470, partial [Bacteroidetes bacterium]|nr:hypothetical protein [Bacteroidota bacterium]
MIPVELNHPQQQAVEHTEGPLLVLAGAGSGKTRVLACRADIGRAIRERYGVGADTVERILSDTSGRDATVTV